MKFCTFLLAGIMATSAALAQTPTSQWIKQMGNTDDDDGTCITLDAAGNIYTSGYFSETVDFDPGVGTYSLTSFGNSDVFISKLDASGNLLWAKSFGGPTLDLCFQHVTDGVGNTYLTGLFSGTVDFDPGSGIFNVTSAGSRDAFISKLDASGNLLWAKSWGGPGSDIGQSLAVDASGNIFILGSFSGTSDFDPGASIFNVTSISNTVDIFISKLDASGNFVWTQSWGSIYSDIATFMTLDASGNIYTSGRFRGTVDFDPGSAGTYNLTSNGADDVFISKLSSSGNLLWANSWGGTSDDEPTSIAVSTSGDVYSTGHVVGTVDFDPGPLTYTITTFGAQNIFISKLNASGNFVWAKKLGGSSVDYGTSIRLDAQDNIYSIGSFEGTADFDPDATLSYNLTSAGASDCYLSKLDHNGNFIWAKSWGGPSYDLSSYMALDASGAIYITGSFQQTIDFNPANPGTSSFTSAGSNDAFIYKMFQNIQTAVKENTFSDPTMVYPNPGTGLFAMELKSPCLVTVTNALGEEVLVKNSASGLQTVDLQHQSNGLYFIMISDATTQRMVKVIKQ